MGEGRMAHQTISDTDATISFCQVELEGELRQAVIFHATVVAHGTRDNVDRLRKREQYCHRVSRLTPSSSTSQSPRITQTRKHGRFDSAAMYG
jgi:hypothetical protein